MILAISASVIMTVFIFLGGLSDNPNPAARQLARFGALTVLPLGIIGAALGISFYSREGITLGAASYLAIVALVINSIAGVIAILIR